MTPDEVFQVAWQATGKAEGGYVYNSYDHGGPTNHGITEAVARADGYEGDIRGLSLERALSIAKRRYWDTMRLDDIAVLSLSIAKELFDTGFLCGQGMAGRFLQQALNLFNKSHGGKNLYVETVEDGVIGPGTVYALKEYMRQRGSLGEVVMLRALNCFQGAQFRDIGRANKDNEEFEFGWFANRIVV